jgi:hypothetical protein
MRENKMAAKNDELKLAPLRSEIRDSVSTFAEKLIEKLGENLKSITIIGSSLTGDFVPGKSNINSVLVLAKQDLGSLNSLAEMARSMRKKKLAAPILMTTAYIERSRDVFGIEFLDFQLIHQTILGDDPFAELSLTKENVRLQCERELKAMLIRLRQGYITAGGQKRLIRDILISAVSGLAPLLRAMLWLKDSDRPDVAQAVFTKAQAEFSVKTDCLINARNWRHKKVRLGDNEIQQNFEAVYATTDRLAVIVDEFQE